MRFGRAGLAAAAGAAALVVGLLTPATHGTFTAELDTSGGAGLTPFFTCAAAAADEQQRGALVFAYPLSDAADSMEAADASGAGRTAKYTGTRLTEWPGRGGCARDGAPVWAPDGESSGLITPQVDLERHFTFEIRFRTANDRTVIAAVTPAGDRSYSLALVDGAAALLGPGGAPFLRGGRGLGDGAWHHLALVLADDSITLYIDSTAVDARPFGVGGGFGASWQLAIGSDADTGGLPPFRGDLAWAELTNRPLSAAEVHAHDLAGRTPPQPGRVRPPRHPPIVVEPAPGTTIDEPADAATAEPAQQADQPATAQETQQSTRSQQLQQSSQDQQSQQVDEADQAQAAQEAAQPQQSAAPSGG